MYYSQKYYSDNLQNSVNLLQKKKFVKIFYNKFSIILLKESFGLAIQKIPNLFTFLTNYMKLLEK